MWEGAKSESRAVDYVFRELMAECRRSPPGARLSARLRAAIERLSPETRVALVSRQSEGTAPLQVAARRGCAEVAEYLVHVCGAPLEQRGAFAAPEDAHVHQVTALWAAAVAGRVSVVRVLAEAGADVDAESDSGSTPARSACFMSHVDVVRYLVSRGADISRPNHNGSTCLINAVQSAELVELLLSCGAAVDARDVQLKTALHYAVQEHRADTVRVLLDHGADPHAVSRAGDDALQTACLKGAAHIVALLIARCRYPASRVADAYELLGATLLDEFNDVSATLESWRRATLLRRGASPPLAKLPQREPRALFGGMREWEELAELEALATDIDALRMQALLVVYRVLGTHHRDAVFRIMYRGAAYADAQMYSRCAELWTWALEVRAERDTLVSGEAGQAATAVTRLLLAQHANQLSPHRTHRHAVAALEILADALPHAYQLIQIQPQCRRQAAQYDAAVRCATQLLHVASGAGGAVRRRVLSAAHRLLAADVRTAHTRDTLLHLAVSRLNVIRSPYFADEYGVPIGVFPSVVVVRLLVRCGADVCARNLAGSTALHVASVPYNLRTDIIHILLAAGAHLDQPNRYGDSAEQLVSLNRGAGICVVRHVSLRCLAARALVSQGLPPRWQSLLPRQLVEFVQLHRPSPD